MIWRGWRDTSLSNDFMTTATRRLPRTQDQRRGKPAFSWSMDGRIFLRLYPPWYPTPVSTPQDSQLQAFYPDLGFTQNKVASLREPKTHKRLMNLQGEPIFSTNLNYDIDIPGRFWQTIGSIWCDIFHNITETIRTLKRLGNRIQAIGERISFLGNRTATYFKLQWNYNPPPLSDHWIKSVIAICPERLLDRRLKSVRHPLYSEKILSKMYACWPVRWTT